MSNFWRCCSRDNHDEWKHCPCCGKERPSQGPSEEDKRAIEALFALSYPGWPMDTFDLWTDKTKADGIALLAKSREICGAETNGWKREASAQCSRAAGFEREAADLRDKLAKVEADRAEVGILRTECERLRRLLELGTQKALQYGRVQACGDKVAQPAQSRTANLDKWLQLYNLGHQPIPGVDSIFVAANADIDAAMEPLQKRIAELESRATVLSNANNDWKVKVAELEAQLAGIADAPPLPIIKCACGACEYLRKRQREHRTSASGLTA